jgi:hypothetical protein
MGTLKLKSQGKKHPKKEKVFLLLNEQDIPFPKAFRNQCKVRIKLEYIDKFRKLRRAGMKVAIRMWTRIMTM